MAKNSQTYWNERSLTLNEKLLALGDNLERELAIEFEKAEGRILKEIEAFYTQFSKDNKISYADAKRMLTTSEKRRFMLNVDDYIKKASGYPYTPEWDSILRNASTASRVTRLQSLQLQMRQQVEELYTIYNGGMVSTAEKIFTEGYYRSIYDIQSNEGYGSPFATLDTETIKKAIAKPWAPDGSNFSEKIWKDREGLVNYLNKELTQALIRGESPDRLIREVQRKFGVTSRNAARLIQTEMSYFATAAKLESYKELGYKRYIINAIMDGKTSVVCREMHYKVFNIDDYFPGATAPPFHPRCRTAIAPYAGSRVSAIVYKQGSDIYIVPEDMSFDEWYKQFVEDKTAEVNKHQDSSFDELNEVDNPNHFETINIEDIDKKLQEYENNIIDQNFESAYVIQPDGNVYLFEGEAFSVLPEGISFEDAIVLHNHPVDEWGLVDSFSKDDIDFMKLHPEVSEHLLVGGEYEYRLKVLKEINLIWSDIFNGGIDLARRNPDEDSPQHYMMEYLKLKGYVGYERKVFNRKPT